ncbi:hypothetical protein GGR08_001489 [Bartonella fuyuanensis]|uniref:Uncharacterized protein n=1 Tax=Bartonella fuyuanensis TaxID=1460968 RepID=A0A840DW62_9HYPH|nr:hypothetical protein [Bartonella fuyuanensis]
MGNDLRDRVYFAFCLGGTNFFRQRKELLKKNAIAEATEIEIIPKNTHITPKGYYHHDDINKTPVIHAISRIFL